MESVDLQNLRQLLQVNAKLKKGLAERGLEIDVMNEGAASRFAVRARFLVRPGRRRSDRWPAACGLHRRVIEGFPG